jgi:hypothetical protein
MNFMTKDDFPVEVSVRTEGLRGTEEKGKVTGKRKGGNGDGLTD